MASKAGIINAALHHLGEDESTEPLTDDSTWVRRIRNRYDERVQALFESHSWNFATTVEALNATEPTPEGFAYGFAKPGGCWCIIKVGGSSDPDCDQLTYEDRAGRICTNSETAYLTYVDRYWKDYPGAWAQCVADALSSDLAYRVCPVTGKGKLSQSDLLQIAARDRKLAKNWDAMQNRTWTPPPSGWQRSRFAGRGSRYNG